MISCSEEVRLNPGDGSLEEYTGFLKIPGVGFQTFSRFEDEDPSLKEMPFENTPDPKFLYHSQQHEEGLSRLLYVVRESKGLSRQAFWEQHMKDRGYSKSQVYRLDASCKHVDLHTHNVDLWKVSGWSGNKYMAECERLSKAQS